METESGLFVCLWCGTAFGRRRLSGRKPCYCDRSCRQRAYEARRRGAICAGHPHAPPATPHQKQTPRYEAGRRLGITHALRPDGLPDPRGRRVTLCGTYSSAIRPPFGALDVTRDICRTCDRIAEQHPPPRQIDPPRDVAVLTNLARRLQADLVTHSPTAPTAGAIVRFCWPSTA
jgi:hypothetical protein